MTAGDVDELAVDRGAQEAVMSHAGQGAVGNRLNKRRVSADQVSKRTEVGGVEGGARLPEAHPPGQSLRLWKPHALRHPEHEPGQALVRLWIRPDREGHQGTLGPELDAAGGTAGPAA